MKLGLIFVAGLLVGVAVGLLAGGFGEGTGDGGRAGGTGRSSASYGPGGAGSAPGGKGSRPGRSGKGAAKEGAVHSPAGASEMMEYLKDLALVDDIEEVNLMEMIRYANQVTTMTEGEVRAMLDILRAEAGKEERPEDNQDELHQVLGAILFARLAEVNGPEAMRMALSGEFAEMGEDWEGDEAELIMMGLTAWVGADSQGAAAWFKEAAGSDAKFREILEDEYVGSAFFAAMARADGKRARELLHEVGEFAPDGAAAVARYESIEGLQSLLESTAGESREEVFYVMSERNPEEARKWLEAHGDLESRDDYVDVLARELLDDDPEAGAEWYMQQEVSEERESQRTTDIVSAWVGEDAVAAQEWLSAQPDSPQRDTAEMVVAMHLASQHSDWEGGLTWAAQVGDDKQRRQAVERIFANGWDRRQNTLRAGVAEAARATGFEAEMDRFVEEHRGDR